MTMPTDPVRPVAGYYKGRRDILLSLKCPERCIYTQLLLLADIHSGVVFTTYSEICADLSLSRGTCHAAVKRLISRDLINVSVTPKGIYITVNEMKKHSERMLNAGKLKSRTRSDRKKSRPKNNNNVVTFPDLNANKGGVCTLAERPTDSPYIINKEERNNNSETPLIPLETLPVASGFETAVTLSLDSEVKPPVDTEDKIPWTSGTVLPMKPLQPPTGWGSPADYEGGAVYRMERDDLERFARLRETINPETPDIVLAWKWAEHTKRHAKRHNIVPEYYVLLVAEARFEMGWDYTTMDMLFEFATGTPGILFDLTVTPYKLLSQWSNGMTLLENIRAKFLASSKGKTLKKKANLQAAFDALDALDTP